MQPPLKKAREGYVGQRWAITQKGKTVLPEIRHIQIVWEWCPTVVPYKRASVASVAR